MRTLLALSVVIYVAGCGGVEPDAVVDAADLDAPTAIDGAPPIDSAPIDGVPADAAPVTAELVAAFPGTSNPNGVWSYGFATGVNTPFMRLATLGGDATAPLWGGDNAVTGGAHFWKNLGTTVRYGVAPGAVSGHPGAQNQLAVVRYTAPFAGRFTAHIEAGAGDVGATSVLVRVAGVGVHSANSPTTFDLTPTTLAAGDTLDVAIGSLGDWSADNTPIIVTVTGTPGG